MKMQNWIEVKSFANQIEAEIAKSVLESVGIESQIHTNDSAGGPYLGSALGGTGHYLGMLACISLLVPQKQLEAATQLLKTFKN